jgi:hypothetical protein
LFSISIIVGRWRFLNLKNSLLLVFVSFIPCCYFFVNFHNFGMVCKVKIDSHPIFKVFVFVIM